MMKKWMIRFMSVLAVFALSVGVAGCGQDEDQNNVEDTVEQAGEEAEEAAEDAEGAMDEAVDEMDNE